MDVYSVSVVTRAVVHTAAPGPVQRPGDADAVAVDGLGRLRQLGDAAGHRGQVDDHAAGLHASHHRCGNDLRRRAPGHRGGADDHVDALEVFAQPALLLGALLVGELARIAALARGADAKVEELAAQRLDLLPRLRAHVEAFDLRAQAPGRRPRLQSEEHTSELQSLMRTSYAVFCLKKK